MSEGRPPRSGPPGSPPPPRPGAPARPQGPSEAARRVMSAQRAAPPAPEKPVAVGDRLKTGASELVLNTAGVLRDLLKDFQRRDRFTKYKAGVLAGWIALSVACFFVACPQGGLQADNALDARLVLNTLGGRTVIMIVNDGDDPWTEVTVVVNGRFRASTDRVAPGGNLTLSAKQLLAGGEAAPNDLTVRDLELRADEGRSQLMKDGQAQ